MLLALALPPLAGCAPGPAGGRLPSLELAEATRQVVMNYLLAHGMAESYVLSGRATEADLLRLVAYDKAALAAINGAAQRPGWVPVRNADQAVQALIAYTTTQDVGHNTKPS